MFAVGPHDEVVVAPLLHARPQAFQPLGIDAHGKQRLGHRHPECRKLDVGEHSSFRGECHRSSSGFHGVAAVAPRSMIAKLPASTAIHGPTSPSGH